MVNTCHSQIDRHSIIEPAVHMHPALYHRMQNPWVLSHPHPLHPPDTYRANALRRTRMWPERSTYAATTCMSCPKQHQLVPSKGDKDACRHQLPPIAMKEHPCKKRNKRHRLPHFQSQARLPAASATPGCSGARSHELLAQQATMKTSASSGAGQDRPAPASTFPDAAPQHRAARAAIGCGSGC